MECSISRRVQRPRVQCETGRFRRNTGVTGLRPSYFTAVISVQSVPNSIIPILESHSGNLFVVERDNPFAHCTQFCPHPAAGGTWTPRKRVPGRARSRLGPFECPNSTSRLWRDSLQDHLFPPIPHRGTLGVWYNIPVPPKQDLSALSLVERQGWNWSKSSCGRGT